MYTFNRIFPLLFITLLVALAMACSDELEIWTNPRLYWLSLLFYASAFLLAYALRLKGALRRFALHEDHLKDFSRMRARKALHPWLKVLIVFVLFGTVNTAICFIAYALNIIGLEMMGMLFMGLTVIELAIMPSKSSVSLPGPG